MLHTIAVALVVTLLSAPAFAQTPPVAAPIPGPSSASAEKMIAAARAKGTDTGVALACVVVDIHGDIVAALRMDGAPFLTVAVAQGKATASAFFGQPSGLMGQLGAVLPSIGIAAGRTLLALPGALPIVQNNRRVGAMGCSGGTGQQDEDGARAGIAAGQ